MPRSDRVSDPTGRALAVDPPSELLYRRWPAPRGTEHLVDHLWVVRAPRPDGTRREVLIPDGHPLVVVPLERPGRRIDLRTGVARPNDGLLVGVSVTPVVLEEDGPSWYVGARLTATGVGPLTGGPLLVGEVVPLEPLLGLDLVGSLRRSATQHGPSDDAAVALLARLLVERARQVGRAVPDVPRRGVERAVTVTKAAGGDVRVATLAAEVGADPTTLRRWFRAHVGVSPKTMTSLVRLDRLVGALVTPGGGPAAVAAALEAYADASHAAAELRRFAGVTPAVLRRRANAIAALAHGGPEVRLPPG